MGKFLEFVFNRFFLGMIATAFFWLFTLAGGVVFGLAPASATLMSLYAEHGYTYRAYSLKEAWELYKSNFVKSNLAFYSFVLVDLVLVYGLYLFGSIASSDDFPSLGNLSQYPCCCLCFFGLYRFIETTSSL